MPLPTALFPFLWQFIRQQKYWFLGLIACHLGWALDHTVMPYIFKLFIDEVIGFTGDRAEAWHVMGWIVAAGAGMWIMLACMYRGYDFLASRTYPRFEAAIRMAMLRYVQQHSYKYFADHLAGELAGKLEDMPEGATRVMQTIVTLFIPSLAAMLIGTSIFVTLHPLFGVVVCGWFIGHIAICLCYARKCNMAADRHSASKNLINGKIVDSFTNMATVKSFARRQWEYNYTKIFQADEQQKHQYVLYLIFTIRILLDICCFVMMGVVMTWLMVAQWQLGAITAGDVVYIFYSSWGIVMMAWVCGMEMPEFFQNLGICRQALRLIETPHEIIDVPHAAQLVVKHGEIRFDNVTFCYQRNNNLFENQNVTIKAGSKIGLVGFSGSGKTSFVHLLMRFYEVDAGRIVIDGQDIARVTQDSLHEHIAMIPQDTRLFHRTIKENIRYGRVTASDEEVIEVAKQAYCHEFIMKLPEGYDTEVGERGVKLSGGQRQRIAIARALLKNAPILILDEATSALDSMTEKQIQESLEKLMAGRTTIIIAHRLSTLSEVDRIMVFDKGTVIEDGTHAELLAQGKHYARMWHMQAGGFLPEKEEV